MQKNPMEVKVTLPRATSLSARSSEGGTMENEDLESTSCHDQ